MNIRKFYIAIIIVFLLLIAYQIEAQDIQFSQFYAAAPYLNPAFAGSTHQTRGMFHQRLQWPRLDARYITSMAAVDTYVDTYRSGFGLMAIHDVQGNNTIATTEIQGMYSYELPLTADLTFRPGLQLGYVNRRLNFSQLYFSPDIDDMGNIYYNNTGNPRTHFVDVSSGGILYSSNFWVGISAHHMNRPNQSFIGEVSRLPIKYAFVGGYKFSLKKNSYQHSMDKSSEFSLIPTFHYKKQGQSDQLDLGVYLIYDQLLAGLWYRGLPFIKQYLPNLHNNEAVIALIGWKFDNVSIGYSYDMTVSRLAPARSGGAHELNITYVHSKRRKMKKRRALPCPTFK
ncbi:MAG: type IX secretion system membrane protein PorP/SprF [Cytophagaceae bacterium]